MILLGVCLPSAKVHAKNLFRDGLHQLLAPRLVYTAQSLSTHYAWNIELFTRHTVLPAVLLISLDPFFLSVTLPPLPTLLNDLHVALNELGHADPSIWVR